MTTAPTETVFAWEAPPLRFGTGATAGVGFELDRLGVRRALVVTDPGIRATGLADEVVTHAARAGVEAVLWSGTEIEPSDASVRRAVEELSHQQFDGFIGLGGGSSLDTCKIINLLLTYPGELTDYLSRPHGGGREVPGPLAPMIGIPTTAGTGSECSAIAVLNLIESHVKGAVSSPRLRPALAIVDPLNTSTSSAAVTASAGYDALVQTLESYTSLPYDQRARRELSEPRPVYSGSTPISDVWCERALVLMGQFLGRAILDGSDLAARTGMSQAALFSRLGTAGAHIPHSAAYAVSGLVRAYRPPEFGAGPPLVPHGMSVVVTAAAAFDYTGASAPERHRRAAALLGADVDQDDRTGTALSDWLRRLVRDTNGPAGLDAFGFGTGDLPALVDGALTQSRLLVGSPRPVDRDALAEIFRSSFSTSGPKVQPLQREKPR